MKFSTGLSNSIKAASLVMALMLSICCSNVFADSCAKANTTTSKTKATLPSVRSVHSMMNFAPLGQAQAPSTQSIAQQNQSTDFIDSKTRRLSATNLLSDYGSAARTLDPSNSSATSITFTFQNSRRTNPTNSNPFYENATSKTVQRFSVNEQPRSFKIFATLPETNLKTSMIAPSKRLFIRASKESAVGDTSARWRRLALSLRALSPFSTNEPATFAANSTARSFALELRRPPLNDSMRSNPATSPSRCMNRTWAKRFQETLSTS